MKRGGLRTGWLVCLIVMMLFVLQVNAYWQYNQNPFFNPAYGVYPFLHSGYYPSGGFDVFWNALRVGTPVYGWQSLGWPVVC